jgi:uncharacterized phage infection (PIP) family protein YhgE
MTIITTPYTAVAGQALQATKKSVEIFKQGAKSFTDQLGAIQSPSVDLTEPVARYFEYLQKAVDFSRDLATNWAELLNSLTGSVREQAQQVSSIVKDQTDTVADLAVRQAAQVQEAARDQADKVEQAQREQAERIEDAEQAQAREVKRIQRAEAKQAREQARESYEGLTKAELSERLSELGLPKTGNVEDLIERLVDADSA